MTFLNSLPLWGGLAAAGIAVPIIIHLLHQRHRRRTDWAAMELLRRALVIRSGQVRLEDLLILLLRCLVLALVAFAMLRPSLRNENAQILGGEQRVGMVVAIDASYSMAHGKHSKRFDRALEKASEILKSANVGDPVSLVLLGDKTRTLLRGSSYDEHRFREVLENAKTLPEGLNLERCLVETLGLVTELKASIRECYLITDAQAVDWENLSADARSGLESIADDASLFITPVGVDGEENLSVMSFEYVSGSLVPSGTVRFAAEVRNHGRQLSEGGTATLEVDGQDVTRQSIGSIKEGESRMISFYASFDKGGDSKVRVILGPDSLSLDNERQTVVHVREKIRILCAHGEPASGDRPSEVFYLVRALELKKSGESATLEVVRADWQDLDAEDFKEYDVIFLANVPTIAVDVAKRLKDFVGKGGGLAIYAGEKLDAESYNAQLHGGDVNLLPGEIVDMVSFEGDDTRSENDETKASWTIGPIQSDHVLASLAESIPEEGRSAAKIRKVIQVKPDEDSDTILRLSRSDLPLLLEKQVGEGTVLLVTTTADRDWGNLSVHPFFPMMVQQSITHFTSRPGERTVALGAPGKITLAGLQANHQVTLSEPDGEPLAVNLLKGSSGIPYCAIDSDAPGFYEVEPVGLPSSALAVNINAGEADVKVFSSDSLGTALGKPEWVISPQADLAKIISQSREGFDLSRTLLILALLIFLLQGFLAKMYTNRMTGETGDVTESLRKQTVAAARRT
ncbi:MAG: VWA domain-containing protein [Opitutae bacterium]|nr:VWA domain-containing protein [Opitutae bacterium]